ncbi:MAG: hypothetical protein HFG41_04420 [Coprococcus sp.]|nr:hypothetical protein [Coprococcus sp.]
MKRFKKAMTFIIMLAVMLGAMPAASALTVQAGEDQEEDQNPEVRAASPSDIAVRAAESKNTISFKYSETKKIELIVENKGTETLDVTITPRVSEKIREWPFEIENKDYTQEIKGMEGNTEQKIEYTFTARENVSSKYYKLIFAYTVTDTSNNQVVPEGECGIYVKTIAKPEEKPQNPSDQNTQNPPADDTQEPIGDISDAGGIINGDVSSGSGGGDGSSVTATPRVIVTGFTTSPAVVKAGTNFSLTIHLKNTSKKTAVSNMLFELSAPTEGMDANTASPAFLPASGSNSIYLEGIKANGTADISIELNAKADLVQKPYSVDVSMKYEDSEGGQYDSASAVSIPVKQDARFEFSEFEISPASISIGDEANIMCELHNLGRVKLYNVKAKFEGDGISTEEQFIGNVESGATANIDAMLTGETVTAGPVSMKMTMSYEDEDGAVKTEEKEFQLEVMEMMEPVDMGEMMIEEPETSFPYIPVIAVVVVIAAAIAGIVIYKKKKKQKLQKEEEGLADEFDRLTEDEHRES